MPRLASRPNEGLDLMVDSVRREEPHKFRKAVGDHKEGRLRDVPDPFPPYEPSIVVFLPVPSVLPAEDEVLRTTDGSAIFAVDVPCDQEAPPTDLRLALPNKTHHRPLGHRSRLHSRNIRRTPEGLNLTGGGPRDYSDASAVGVVKVLGDLVLLRGHLRILARPGMCAFRAPRVHAEMVR